MPADSFHVADKSFYTNNSGCTDLIYHANLDILWVLYGVARHKVVNGLRVFIIFSAFWVNTIF